MLGYVTTQQVLLHQLAQKHYHSDPALRVVLLIKLSHCQEIAVDLTDQNIIINTIYQIQQYFYHHWTEQCRMDGIINHYAQFIPN
jgi:hypothetical protein